MAARVLLDCKRPPKRSSPELLLMSKKLSAVHPGEVLREEFLVPMKLSPYAVARVVSLLGRVANSRRSIEHVQSAKVAGVLPIKLKLYYTT